MKQHIEDLLDKYLSGHADESDLLVLYNYFNSEQNEAALEEQIQAYLHAENIDHTDAEDIKGQKIADNAWLHIKPKIHSIESEEIKRISVKWIAIVAAMLIIGLTITFVEWNNKPAEPQLTSIYGGDVMPGSHKAILILSNGKRFELKDNKAGVTIEGNGITYLDGETITSTNEVMQATIEVPKGGIYRIKLPDGTSVQLNSGSTFSYPTRFEGMERLVKLKGEGYFEVSHNPAKPFKVQSGGQTLTVLGTHFNIQAYDKEPIETTLLEGKVLVQASDTKGSAILAPNQQSKLSNDKFTLKNVNARDYIGWTKNLFVFNDLTLGQIFKHLERWYDVEIDYPTDLSDKQFMMEIPKDRKLSEILNAISSLEELSFKIQGRRITATHR